MFRRQAIFLSFPLIYPTSSWATSIGQQAFCLPSGSAAISASVFQIPGEGWGTCRCLQNEVHAAEPGDGVAMSFLRHGSDCDEVAELACMKMR
jgi:hypothetical protein